MSGRAFLHCTSPACLNMLRVREGMPRKCAECVGDADLLLSLATQDKALLDGLIVALHFSRMSRLLAIMRTGSAPAEVRS